MPEVKNYARLGIFRYAKERMYRKLLVKSFEYWVYLDRRWRPIAVDDRRLRSEVNPGLWPLRS